MRLLPAGAAAVLVELDPNSVLPFSVALREQPHPAVTDIVPADRTVLVRFSPAAARPAQIAAWLRSVRPASTSSSIGPLRQIDVHYDGDDLADVARLTNLTPDEVIAIHAGLAWVVAFSGFAPGFGYLRPADEADAGRLQVPRRDEPRAQVPVGAVALAAGYTGIYPRASPGGWQLIGRTAAPLWDVDRDPPALLAPGVRVRFRNLDATG